MPKSALDTKQAACGRWLRQDGVPSILGMLWENIRKGGDPLPCPHLTCSFAVAQGSHLWNRRRCGTVGNRQGSERVCQCLQRGGWQPPRSAIADYLTTRLWKNSARHAQPTFTQTRNISRQRCSHVSTSSLPKFRGALPTPIAVRRGRFVPRVHYVKLFPLDLSTDPAHVPNNCPVTPRTCTKQLSSYTPHM